MGQKIASDKVTLIDDGSLPGLYGSSMFDDEGMPRQKNVLIENGVLTAFMADRLGAKRIAVPVPPADAVRAMAMPPVPG